MHCSKSRAQKYFPWLTALCVLLNAGIASAQNTSITNRALKLDGSGSYVELPRDIFKNHTQATVEVWAKWLDFQAFSRVFEFGAGYQSISLFNHMTNADLRFNIYPRFAKYDTKWMYTVYARNVLRTNEWMHFAAVSGPGGMKLYANGRLVAKHTNTTTFADIDVTQTNLLGRGLAGNPTDRDFRGELDEVRVWDHERSLAQIREDMFKRLTGAEDGLTHLWNFDDGTAKDSGPSAHHGKLRGKARIGRALDLDLTIAAAPPPPPAPVIITNVVTAPPVASAPPTNVAPAPVVPPVHVAVTAPPSNNNAAIWLIAGSLSSLVFILAFILLTRRQNMDPKLPSPAPTRALAAGDPAVGEMSAANADKELKDRALADLTEFAKESLVQGLYSQRAALLAIHKKAQQEMAELEARVVALRLPERIEAYEKRITELERELENKSDELRELHLATLQLLREKVAEEKQKQVSSSRFN